LQLFFLGFKRNKKASDRNNSIYKKIQERNLLNFNWKQFDQYYVDKGFTLQEIHAVKKSIQDYSSAAKQALFPKDHMYNDLLGSSYGKEEKEIMEEIEKSFKVSLEGELKEEMLPLVGSCFQIIKLAKSNLS
jgi:hypothetical protein